jgi:hypothetical protein
VGGLFLNRQMIAKIQRVLEESHTSYSLLRVLYCSKVHVVTRREGGSYQPRLTIIILL